MFRLRAKEVDPQQGQGGVARRTKRRRMKRAKRKKRKRRKKEKNRTRRLPNRRIRLPNLLPRNQHPRKVTISLLQYSERLVTFQWASSKYGGIPG